jgi:hypothetical protein
MNTTPISTNHHGVNLPEDYGIFKDMNKIIPTCTRNRKSLEPGFGEKYKTWTELYRCHSNEHDK